MSVTVYLFLKHNLGLDNETKKGEKMKKRKYRTDVLFPRTSFLIGAGSIFNLAGNYFEFNSCSSSAKADSLAIENDWGVIGNELRDVVSKKPIKRQRQKA